MAIPVAIAYSPKTQTDGITLIGATEIVIDNTINEGIASFPDASVTAPGEAVIHVTEHFNTEDPADYETITYTERHVASNELRGVTRGVEGTAREWPAATWIAAYTSAAAWNEMRGDVVAAKAHVENVVPGIKNAIINGNFRINQRVHASGGTLAAGSYGHDRWKAGTGGCNYTFSTTANKTTVTIPSTRELLQVIEGGNLVSDDYTLSWEGSAEGKIGGGAYAASPITASVTGGTNLTITFGAGTIANVQLERGGVATSFELRPINLELSMCQRYFCKTYSTTVAPGTAGGTAEQSRILWLAHSSTVTTRAVYQYLFPTSMRTIPTVTVYDDDTGTPDKLRNIDKAAPTEIDASVQLAGTTGVGIRPTNAADITDGDRLIAHFTADAEL